MDYIVGLIEISQLLILIRNTTIDKSSLELPFMSFEKKEIA
jgi:hypothetical protein